MAFGFPSSSSQYLPSNNLSSIEFLYLALETLKKLEWTILSIDKNEIIAETIGKNKSWNETIIIEIKNNDQLIYSYSNGNQIYDRGRNLKNISIFIDEFSEINRGFSSSVFAPAYFDDYLINKKSKTTTINIKDRNISRFYTFFSAFIPTEDYFITPIIILINITIFLLMTFTGVSFFSPEIRELIEWGANYAPLTLEGNYWRLFSCFFIHIGFFHLVVNCYALSYVGLYLESYLKKTPYLITYLFCGVFASLTSLYWNHNLVSAGASGAILGMFGILIIALFSKKLDKKIDPNTTISVTVFVLLTIADSFEEGIDGAAHIGGLISGLLFGIILSLVKTKRRNKTIIITVLSTILIPSIFLYCKNDTVVIYDIMEYERRMQEFVDMEKMALEANHRYASDSKGDALYLIKERGIYYWEESIKLLNELELLRLPEKIHVQNKRLIKYCKLRIQYYQLGYKKIDENSNQYDAKMQTLDSEIIDLINLIQETANKKE